jgi:hypothetical protein
MEAGYNVRKYITVSPALYEICVPMSDVTTGNVSVSPLVSLPSIFNEKYVKQLILISFILAVYELILLILNK